MKVLLSLLIGTVATLSLVAASHVAFGAGRHTLSHVLYWQGFGAASLVPCNDTSTSEKPFCEGTPLNVVAFFSGIPVGVALYSSVAYWLLFKRRVA